MKYKSFNYVLICLFFLLSVPLLKAQTTDVHITMTDGTVYSYTVYNNGKLYFESDQLIIHESFLQTATHPLSSVRKIIFDGDAESGISYLNNEEQGIIYPNPTSGYITLEGFSVPVHVTIFAIDGRMLLSKHILDNEKIDIQNFPSGLYLLKINDKIFKINKL